MLSTLEYLKSAANNITKSIISLQHELGCEPENACKTHGRCFVHSFDQEKELGNGKCWFEFFDKRIK